MGSVTDLSRFDTLRSTHHTMHEPPTLLMHGRPHGNTTNVAQRTRTGLTTMSGLGDINASTPDDTIIMMPNELPFDRAASNSAGGGGGVTTLFGHAPSNVAVAIAPSLIDSSHVPTPRRSRPNLRSVPPIAQALAQPDEPEVNAPVTESGSQPIARSARSEEIYPSPASEKPSTLAPAAPAEAPAPAASQRVGGAFVKAYRIVGFAILTAILGGLLTYVGTHVFFLVNRAWVAPSILTPADPRVLGFASRLVEESARHDALLVQRADVETRRREAERSVAIEKAFQAAYLTAMHSDLADRKAELARARGMLGSYATARRSMTSAGQAFSASSEQRLKQEFEGGVIDKDHMLGGNLQLAQIADARLTLDARAVEMQGRVASLSRMVDSLDAATTGGAVSSYEIVKIRAEYDRSVAASAKAADELDATTKSVAMIDETIKAEDRILETMQRSAYHGITGRTVFAFVPYDNTGATQVGAPVYACRVGIAVCRKVGKLGKVAEGEVVQKHPLLHQDVRGVLVRMEIDDVSAAENAVLHAGRRPLFI